VLLVTDASLDAAARHLSADKGPASASSYELRHGAWGSTLLVLSSHRLAQRVDLMVERLDALEQLRRQCAQLFRV